MLRRSLTSSHSEACLQRHLDLVVDQRLAPYAADAQTGRDVLVDRFGERVGLLEHHADPQPGQHRIGPAVDDVDAVRLEQDLPLIAVARIQVVHAVEAAQKGALAAAGRADQSGDLTLADRDRDVLERLIVAVPEIEMADVDLVLRRRFDPALGRGGRLRPLLRDALRLGTRHGRGQGLPRRPAPRSLQPVRPLGFVRLARLGLDRTGTRRLSRVHRMPFRTR